MINRQQAIILIKKYIKNENLIKYSLIAEAILKKIARTIGSNEELWGLTGLLHNIDYEYAQDEPEKRGVFASQLLDGLLPASCINAIKSVNYQYLDYVPSTSLDKSLVATVALTNFIIDIINTSPQKDISGINASSIKNKLYENNFSNTNLRNRILLCKDVGISLMDFLELGSNSVREIYKI